MRGSVSWDLARGWRAFSEKGLRVSYRGSDLPLRTPRALMPERGRVLYGQVMTPEVGPAPEWLGPALDEAGGDDVWVDDVVLECCNQAYGLAVAHRAPEVRLEHLVHALTLVPESIELLRQDGISDATLRRESGIIIAKDIPSVPANGEFKPPTSQAMEEVLRHAGLRAYAYRSPVTVDDILSTLFDMTRETDTRNLLNRHRAEWSLREPLEDRPARPRNGAAPPGGRGETIRVSPETYSNGLSSRPDLTEAHMEVPTVTDSYQNSRIDALERTVRELAEALRSNVAKAQPPRTEYVPEPAPPPPVRQTPVPDTSISQVLARMGDVEVTVEQKFRELARTWNVLGDRLQTLEDRLVDAERDTPDAVRADLDRLSKQLDRLQGLENVPQRLERIDRLADNLGRLDFVDTFDQKLGKLETTFSRVLDRIAGLERRLDDKVDGDFDLDPIKDRIEALSRQLSERQEPHVALEPLRDRIDALARQMSERPGLHAELAPIQHRLDTLHRQMQERAPSYADVDLSPVIARLEGLERTIEQRPVVTAGGDVDMQPLFSRLESMERTLEQRLVANGHDVDLQPVMLELSGLQRTINERSTSGVDLGPVVDRMREVENKVGDATLLVETLDHKLSALDSENRATRSQLHELSVSIGNEVRSLSHNLGERLSSMSLAGGQIDPQLIAGAVSQPMQSTVAELRGLVNTDRKEQREQFEYLVQGLHKASQDQHKDLAGVHEAMLKLNGNQQTLAQSMDHWRLEVSGDLGILASRLEQLESRTMAAPAANSNRIEALAVQMEQVTAVLQRKEERRSGFLMWLFGTEDWWSDGWRTPEEREAAHLDATGQTLEVTDYRPHPYASPEYARPEDRPLHG